LLYLKRFVDICVSLSGLILLSPLFLLISVAIRLETPGPIFFRQRRAGQYGREFSIFKFRSMVDGAQSMGAGVFVQSGDLRITRAGNWLRRYSLDELPQLINVLRGEMSLVGPRPTLPYQAERYTAHQKRRLLVKPGITGWAQVNGRSALSWPERIELDIWYVDNWSPWLDLVIILKTFNVVLWSKYIYRKKIPDDDPVSGNGSGIDREQGNN